MFPLLLFLFAIYKFLDFVVRLPRYGVPTERVKFVLITGCDTGFGNLLARRLDRKGFHIFAACLSSRACVALEEEFTVRSRTLVMDVTNPKSVRDGLAIVHRNIPEGEGLWALVNNAGVQSYSMGPCEWLRPEDYVKTADVNLYGTIDVTNVFLPLIKHVHGRIVNIASSNCRSGSYFSAPYLVSLSGLETFSNCLRLELKPYRVSVHVIEPGFYKTPMADMRQWRVAMDRARGHLPDLLQVEYGESYYWGLYKFLKKQIDESGLGSARLDTAVNAYEHAVLGWFPRGRYLVGWDAWLIHKPVSVLPEWLADYCMRRIYGQDLPLPEGVQAD